MAAHPADRYIDVVGNGEYAVTLAGDDGEPTTCQFTDIWAARGFVREELPLPEE